MYEGKTNPVKLLVLGLVIISVLVGSVISSENIVNANVNSQMVSVSVKTGETKKINKVVQTAKKMKGKSIRSFPSYFTSRRWCSDFVHWTAKKSKLDNNKVFPKSKKSVSGLISWYKKKGQYRKNTKGYTPKKGDLVFLSSSSHVGIVDKVTKKHVYIIHGNWSNRVKYTKLKRFGYTRSQKAKIKGYADVEY